jgi:NADH-quinone oxidoreductase subunit G
MIDDKVHKPKAVPLGPHVMLDAERCILCSRCVRFCDEITKTSELGIFNRGDHSEIGLFPGTTLDNPYSGNVIDICPVGALTDRDFRFRVRVWYLDRTKSVCPGCARGCNIEVHTNTRRLHQSKGRRVARLKPRFNGDVNRWWICDEGRYGFHDLDAPSRLLAPQRRTSTGLESLGWPEMVRALAELLRAAGPDRVGVLLSPRMANEDLWLARRLFVEARAAGTVDFRVPPREAGAQDAFLRRADRNPNTRGAELIGLGGGGEEDGGHVLAAAEAGKLGVLWVFGHDLFAARWPESEVGAALARVETVVFQGTNANATSERARLLLPSAAYTEREGTFTNFEGRVQRCWPALEPVGEARADWEILADVARALGHDWRPARAEQLFRELAVAVPAFAGLSYRTLRDHGVLVAGATAPPAAPR